MGATRLTSCLCRVESAGPHRVEQGLAPAMPLVGNLGLPGDRPLPSRAGRCTGPFPGVVYVRSRTLPRPGCPHGRHACRVSGAAVFASARRARGVPPLPAPPPREDAALQDRGGVPRGLARGSLGPRAARRGLHRRGVSRVSDVRAAVLRIRPRALHTVPAAVRHRLLVQAAGRVPLLQRQAHGADCGASRRPRHPAGARAAVGDFTAEAAAGSARRPAQGRRGGDEDFSG